MQGGVTTAPVRITEFRTNNPKCVPNSFEHSSFSVRTGNHPLYGMSR